MGVQSSIGDTRVRAQVLLDGGHETRTFPLVQSRGLVRYGGATLLCGTANLSMWDRGMTVGAVEKDGKNTMRRQTNWHWFIYEPLTP